MSWNKISEHEFTYNEGSLNFTLRGGAFHDDNGDGVPEGVSFENGRPVFMGIKNLRDFHFDVPRGFIVVNGNEYKLVDLDKNPENGEELQLFKPNVGFPQGDDRTIPKAYTKVSEHQFTYNEGSLHYTLTGGAFNDSNGDNIPDGVQIIGPKPCFGADGTVFDTSVENFHFKVPSGALMVNGELYKLAELDDNPDNGYELVIPEKADKIGWTPVDKPMKGFAFKRPSDNNPVNFGSFRLFGAGLVDKNGDGNPDGVEVPTVILGEEIDGVRVTIFETGEPISVIFELVDVGFKVVSEIIRQLQRFGRRSRTTPVGKLILSVSKNVRERFFLTRSLVDKNIAKFDKLAQIGFFLDDVSVILSAGSGEGRVDERE